MQTTVTTESTQHCLGCQQSFSKLLPCLCGVIYYCSAECKKVLARAIGEHICESSSSEPDEDRDTELNLGSDWEENEPVCNYEDIWKNQHGHK